MKTDNTMETDQTAEVPADPEKREMMLNIGPAHPAMHGIVRIVAKLDGEQIQEAEVEIGYLHRGFEKMAEVVDYNGVIPYADRLNYVSPLINNMGYCMTVEKLLGIEVPERCHYVRVILSEISRITDHLTCIGASAMELGAFTVFLYMIKAREYLWDLVEKVTGARLTVTYCRVGGVKADLPEDFAEHVHFHDSWPSRTVAVSEQCRSCPSLVRHVRNNFHFWIWSTSGHRHSGR